MQVMCVGKVEPLKPSWHRPLTSPPSSNRYIYSMISISSPNWFGGPALSWTVAGFLEVVGERRTLAKLTSVMDSTSQPLHQAVDVLSNSVSSRLLQPRCAKEHYCRSFIPTITFNSLVFCKYFIFFYLYSLELYAYLSDSFSCTCCILSCCDK